VSRAETYRRQTLGWLALGIPLVAACVIAVVSLAADSDDRDPVELTSDAPRYASLDELVAASDLVVEATVAHVAAGRTMTAADDPGAGVRTRLYELTVTRILHGDAPRLLVVEEPAELLDGTPVIVDGMEPLRESAQAVWYLVAGEGPSQPYYAVVNAQGRVTP
jgi:hypothetical protein